MRCNDKHTSGNKDGRIPTQPEANFLRAIMNEKIDQPWILPFAAKNIALSWWKQSCTNVPSLFLSQVQADTYEVPLPSPAGVRSFIHRSEHVYYFPGPSDKQFGAVCERSRSRKLMVS